jgi:hypothetical protein
MTWLDRLKVTIVETVVDYTAQMIEIEQYRVEIKAASKSFTFAVKDLQWAVLNFKSKVLIEVLKFLP